MNAPRPSPGPTSTVDGAPVPPGARPMGVEEELLLVDPATGAPLGLATEVRRTGPGEELDGELRAEQVETGTHPVHDADTLATELRRRRRTAIEAAAQRGADVAALATSPIPPDPAHERTVGRSGRYGEIAERFGPVASVQLASGQHVHVEVASPEEAVGVLDRIGPWLPVLRAVSANSPYWRGADTDYASYRTVVWSRWPSAGPSRVFGSVEAYDEAVGAMLATGTLLDEAMVYFEARLSRALSTVEVRVADVCTELDDAVLVAVLARALVTTAAEAWRRGEPPTAMPVEAVRLAHWRAGRSGLGGELVDPRTGRPVAASEALGALRAHVVGALDAAGDTDLAADGCARLLATGTGAERQRAVAAAVDGNLRAVVADAVRRTAS